MRCPTCSSETKVIESREISDSTAVRRRRECKQCKHRFTTYERPELRVSVVKRDGSREEFQEEKVKEGIMRACEKRPVSDEEIEELVREVVQKIRRKGVNEVQSEDIGRLVMKGLKELDKVAYIRFASVYKSFDLESLEKEIKTIKG
ncbi:MAG: transcriptional regulator NrdR [Candidatus Aenigmatarchaeota archaeon]